MPLSSPAALALVQEILDREGALRVNAPLFERQFDDGRVSALRVEVHNRDNDVSRVLGTLAVADDILIIG